MPQPRPPLLEYIDTHCHIHSADYELEADKVIKDAAAEGVTNLLCVGTDLEDSRRAVDFVQSRDNCWASIGLHPHEGAVYANDKASLGQFATLAASPKVVAIGETGLDYHYNHSPKAAQQSVLRFQLALATEHDLPLVFHVRSAFDDFWQILDEFPPVRGVIHSFTDTENVLEQALARGFYIGLNGIMTFTKDDKQLQMAKKVPLNRLLLETDAPYLTPKPFRGTVCEPKHVRVTAQFLANLRSEPLEDLTNAATSNAKILFRL